MSKALSRVNGKPDQSIANEDLSAAGPGGDFEITIDVESAIVNERPAVRGKFGALYEVCKKIDETIISVLGGIRKEQHGSSKSGSLLVLLHCFTDERFLDVFERIESGAIKDDLEQKLLNIGVETNGLVVSIRNMKEVQGIKTNIDKRVKNEKVVNQERDIAGGSKSAETEHAFIKPQIIVQGGAYFQKPDHVSDKLYMSLIKISRKKGYDILMNGGTAVDAVEEAVKVLEDSEYFNAGFGSLLNCDGEVECDAMIMDGNTLSSGAVISGRHFRNPVSLAKLIMNDTHHCALSGEGALKFAVEKGFLICDQNDLIAEHVKESKIPYSKFPSYVCKRFKSSDTVSAVARDKYGHFACAMSTGGVPGTLKGRVSDASMVGCGGYANEHGAATTSGLGESLIKMNLAREVVYLMEGGMNAEEAAENSLQKMRKRFQDSGLGGIIAIDEKGNFGKAFTTNMMGWASIKDGIPDCGSYEHMDCLDKTVNN